MEPGWAVLVLLVLSTLQTCGAAPQHHGVQWVWGVQDEPPLLSRGKRDNVGKQLSATSPGYGHGATAMPSSNETDSLEPNPLMGSAPPPAAPSTNASLQQALTVPTTANAPDETDSPEPESMLSSAPPPAASSTSASLYQALTAPTTANAPDETDSPEPESMLSSAPPPAAPSTSASLHQALTAPTTADAPDETDSPEPETLLPAGPGTEAAPQKGITTIPIRLMSPSEEGTVAVGTSSSSSTEPHVATTPALSAATTGYKGAGAHPVPTHWDTQPWGTAEPVPWDPSGVMSKCLLSILLLALVAATFMVCTGVLGTLLWRRARTARRRLSHTEMLCISSLMPDGDGVTNGPRPALVRRPKILLDGGTEADGDNLTLSSFLPEQA